RTNPGGYSAEGEDSGQFSLGDHRPLEEVIRDVAQLGYLPSFCTACYRLGRTGQDFMDLAKPGKIKDHCDVNAVSTFMEYLLDYAGPSTRAAGTTCITQVLQDMTEPREEITKQFMERVKRGERDVFV
ncbi:MAG: [FeFe] hydrogenase H-cluster radical SAM maturase HydG, partial [Candidatus Hydrogenedentes bacterium]|nr:[FeFe] hydrogenase H-cluster radical SAM maturase HydG [Candidatus Hydrogenedentota bacterium]